MDIKKVGKSDLKVPLEGLGTWAIGGQNWGEVNDDESIDAIRVAVENGVTLIDTAPIYGFGHSEKIVGEAIKDIRDKVILSTKCGLMLNRGGMKNLSPEQIRKEVDESRRRLLTDWIDVYFCHWPDPKTPIEETMEELLRLKEQGIIRAIGLSNYAMPEIEKALTCGPVDCLQDHFSLLKQERLEELQSLCIKHSMSFFGYGSLGGGVLSGKYTKQPLFIRSDVRSFFYPFYKAHSWPKLGNLFDKMSLIAKEHSVPVSSVAIAWASQDPTVTSVLCGAKNSSQAFENAKAIEVRLSFEEWNLLKIAGREVLSD